MSRIEAMWVGVVVVVCGLVGCDSGSDDGPGEGCVEVDGQQICPTEDPECITVDGERICLDDFGEDFGDGVGELGGGAMPGEPLATRDDCSRLFGALSACLIAAGGEVYDLDYEQCQRNTRARIQQVTACAEAPQCPSTGPEACLAR